MRFVGVPTKLSRCLAILCRPGLYGRSPRCTEASYQNDGSLLLPYKSIEMSPVPMAESILGCYDNNWRCSRCKIRQDRAGVPSASHEKTRQSITCVRPVLVIFDLRNRAFGEL
jgi:hypothetical protein